MDLYATPEQVMLGRRLSEQLIVTRLFMKRSRAGTGRLRESRAAARHRRGPPRKERIVDAVAPGPRSGTWRRG
jgi:hypothetical protein